MLSKIMESIKKLPKKAVKVILGVGVIFVVFMLITMVSTIISTTQKSQHAKEQYEENTEKIEEIRDFVLGKVESASNTSSKYEGNVMVQFIDVGQGDCTLVTDGNNTMLVDAGNNADGKLIVEYLKDLGVNKIDYLIGTHPHEDHIGGLDAVLEAFPVGILVMPDVTADTQTYSEVINAASANDVSIHHPEVGETWNVGVAECTVLSCEAVEDMSDLNEWSIVLRIDTPNTDYMLMSDAQVANEDAIMHLDFALKADYYRAGHHGSSDANSEAFLKLVKPDYVVVSVGDNDYGHPHDEPMKLFRNIADYTITTADHGTVSVYSYSGRFTLSQTDTDGLEAEREENVA